MILVDFDRTLAHYESNGSHSIGKPVPAMVERVKYWIAKGKEVRIFTARAAETNPRYEHDMRNIKEWCKRHLGRELLVQNWKDFTVEAIWDDLAVSVEANTGRIVRRLDLDVEEPRYKCAVCCDTGCVVDESLIPTAQIESDVLVDCKECNAR